LCGAVTGRRRRRGWRRRPTGANGGGLGDGVGGPWVTLPRERREGEGPIPNLGVHIKYKVVIEN
jgi:hypothetical protein